MKTECLPLAIPFESSDFDVFNLRVVSKALKNNPLGDSFVRSNYVLAPKKLGTYPVVFHLSGYFSTGYQAFNSKTLEDNLPDLINQETATRTIPLAIHVFVDAMTAFGGSQFINSSGCGRYGDYVQNDVLEAVEEFWKITKENKYRCVMGSSSGGYGALEHISQKNSAFGTAVAIAPDSGFEISLLPDFYKVSEQLKTIKSVKDLREKLQDDKFRGSRVFFPTMNAVAMTLCYSDIKKGVLDYPIDLDIGAIEAKVFTQWQKKDPVYFLEERKAFLKKAYIYLEVGRYDEYCLYFGARRIEDVLRKNKVPHHYNEFEGGHFKTSYRKIEALKWLKDIWT
ncbi:MAG: hypothetical protein H6623_06625 [Bdellovibrionaceae bacterium]|nr:hypothetical protein [Pseudobdellovibrionaceae bacterium]